MCPSLCDPDGHRAQASGRSAVRVIVNRKPRPARPCDRGREPEGRGRQDHDRDQSRHRARRLRQAHPARSTSTRRAMPAPASASSSAARAVTSYDVVLGQATLDEAVLRTAGARASSWCRRRSICRPPRSSWSSDDAARVPAAGRAREPDEGLRLRADRLPALARAADRQRAGRRARRAGAAAVRVLRARGAEPAAAHDRAGAAQLQPDARRCRASC